MFPIPNTALISQIYNQTSVLPEMANNIANPTVYRAPCPEVAPIKPALAEEEAITPLVKVAEVGWTPELLLGTVLLTLVKSEGEG